MPFAAAVDSTWTFTPGPALAVAVAGGLYALRWRAARSERGAQAGVGRALLFAAGLLVIVVALMSPVDSLSDRLLAVHMVQHVLLLDIVPILLLLGLTRVLLRPATRRLQRIEEKLGWFGHPVTAAVLYVGVMWFWQVPVFYEAALDSDLVHVIEHLSYSVLGGLYWWHLLSPIRSRLRLGGMGPVVYMLGTKLAVGLLGIVLTFAPDALYPSYEKGPGLWGLTPGEDQSLAGLVMATEQSIVMGIALAWLFARMLGESDREEERSERYA